MIKEGEVRPEGCICEPSSDIQELYAMPGDNLNIHKENLIRIGTQ